ncbi:MAG: alpha/beta hydrolase [Chloroflexi bacterium]|nr:alpha/beta hydrolase [Chloroflexota bacterium]
MRIRMLMVMLLITLVAGALIPAVAQDLPGGVPAELPDGVLTEDFTVDFGDFTSNAQLTYPAEGDGPFPTLILIHGSGFADMDFTQFGLDGGILSTIFRDIGYYLPTQGYAVIRYNKHYVDGPGQFDFQAFTGLRPPQLVTDASSVLDVALELAPVDPEQIYIYGWSEGSAIGTTLFVQRPDDLAGLILQGALGIPFVDALVFQTVDVTGEYLRGLAPDGVLTEDLLLEAAADPNAGLVIQGTVQGVLLARNQLTFAIEGLSPAIDTDGDGVIILDDWLADVPPFFEQLLGQGQFVESITTQVDALAAIDKPILQLHGSNDANIPPEAALAVDEALAEAGHSDHTVIIYDGLGHSLGLAETVFADNFAPIALEPLADLVAWLDERTAESVD